MSDGTAPEERPAEEHVFSEELQPVPAAQEHLSIEDLHDLKLEISAELGQCHVTVREVLELQRGSVLKLNKVAGDMADVYLNGMIFGKGEVVVLVDSVHVRLGEIIGATEPEAGYA